MARSTRGASASLTRNLRGFPLPCIRPKISLSENAETLPVFRLVAEQVVLDIAGQQRRARRLGQVGLVGILRDRTFFQDPAVECAVDIARDARHLRAPHRHSRVARGGSERQLEHVVDAAPRGRHELLADIPLESRDRRRAGQTVPPKGLSLEEVYYEGEPVRWAASPEVA